MTAQIELLKLPQVLQLTTKSRTSLLTDVRRGDFPKPISTGRRSIAWLASEVNAWIEQRAAARFPGKYQEGGHE